MWEKIKKFFMWVGVGVLAVGAFLLGRRCFDKRRVGEDKELLRNITADADRQSELNGAERASLDAEGERIESERSGIEAERRNLEREGEIGRTREDAIRTIGEVIGSVEERGKKLSI